MRQGDFSTVRDLPRCRCPVMHIGRSGTFKTWLLENLVARFQRAGGGQAIIVNKEDGRYAYEPYQRRGRRLMFHRGRKLNVLGTRKSMNEWNLKYVRNFIEARARENLLIIEDLFELFGPQFPNWPEMQGWLIDLATKVRFGMFCTLQNLRGRRTRQVAQNFRIYVFHFMDNRQYLNELLGSRAAALRVEERMVGMDLDRYFIVDKGRGLMSPDFYSVDDCTPIIEVVLNDGIRNGVPLKRLHEHEKEKTPLLGAPMTERVTRLALEHPKWSDAEIAKRAGTSAGSVAGLLTRMRARGFIPRKRRPEWTRAERAKYLKKLEASK